MIRECVAYPVMIRSYSRSAHLLNLMSSYPGMDGENSLRWTLHFSIRPVCVLKISPESLVGAAGCYLGCVVLWRAVERMVPCMVDGSMLRSVDLLTAGWSWVSI